MEEIYIALEWWWGRAMEEQVRRLTFSGISCADSRVSKECVDSISHGFVRNCDMCSQVVSKDQDRDVQLPCRGCRDPPGRGSDCWPPSWAEALFRLSRWDIDLEECRRPVGEIDCLYGTAISRGSDCVYDRVVVVRFVVSFLCRRNR